MIQLEKDFLKFSQAGLKTTEEQNYVSFYERKAFVDDFRRKWKEDQGLVSLFDKR